MSVVDLSSHPEAWQRHAPTSPLGVPATEAERRLVELKFANFKRAVEAGKQKIECEHVNRTERYQQFRERLSNARGENQRGAATRRFLEREGRCVAAKCRTWSVSNFAPIQVLGAGTFGVVHLVRHRTTGKYYALKQMNKAYSDRSCMGRYRERIFAERDALAETQRRSSWCVALYATFHDANYVYMLMEFVQGGDLMFHLANHGRLGLGWTRFLMAELLEALDAVHKRGFVHRDVKPDNILISATGHVKLLDFGLCKSCPEEEGSQPKSDGTVDEFHTPSAQAKAKTEKSARSRLKSVVGTPQYMAPEAYLGDVSAASDIWSLGIVAFECVSGFVPFHAGSAEGQEAFETMRGRVRDHAANFPERLGKLRQLGLTTPEADQFLTRVICARESRINAEQCRSEPFFSGIDFAGLHSTTPPFVPNVKAPGDTSFFDPNRCHRLPAPGPIVGRDANLEWTDYKFDCDAYELQQPGVDVDALFDAEN